MILNVQKENFVVHIQKILEYSIIIVFILFCFVRFYVLYIGDVFNNRRNPIVIHNCHT